MKNLAGVNLAKVGGGICESPKFKMAAIGQVDNCILSVLAHITALDLGSVVIWGKELISDVSFIDLHTAYLDSKFKMAAVGHFEYNFNNFAYSAAQ